MMFVDVVAHVLTGTFIVLMIAAAVSCGFSAFYMFKTLNRFHPERKWGQFLPVSLFIPWFFTDEGNIYRVKLLKAGGIFLLIAGSVLVVGFFTGMLDSEPKGLSDHTSVEHSR
jgi:hypothetical protein